MARIDWAAAKRDYVLGTVDPATGNMEYPSQKEIGLKYGVSSQTVAKHAKRDDWKGEREESQQRVGQELSEKREKMGIDSLEEIYTRQFTVVKKAQITFMQAVKEGKVKLTPDEYLRFADREKEISEVVHGVEHSEKSEIEKVWEQTVRLIQTTK